MTLELFIVCVVVLGIVAAAIESDKQIIKIVLVPLLFILAIIALRAIFG